MIPLLLTLTLLSPFNYATTSYVQAAVEQAKPEQEKPETKEAELSELSKLKIENHLLKIQLVTARYTIAQREASIAELELNTERANLIEALRIELKADKDDVFNFETLKFEKKEKDEKAPIK